MKKLFVLVVLGFFFLQIDQVSAQSRGDAPAAAVPVVAAPTVNAAAEKFADKGKEAVYAGDNATALKMYDEAVKLDPKNAKYRYDKAMAYLNLDNPAGAMIELQIVIELDPQKVDAYGHLGVIHYKMHDYKQCAIETSKGIALFPNNAFLYYQRGQCYYQMVDTQEYVQADLKKAIELDPSYAARLKAK
jgi:tetratricopeptide (TPR) repeat protein